MDEQQSYLHFHWFRFWAELGGRGGSKKKKMKKEQEWQSIQSPYVKPKNIFPPVTVREAKVSSALFSPPEMTVEGS